MKKFWGENKKTLLLVFIILVIWRIALAIPVISSGLFIQKNYMYLGPIPLANFDGVHYLSIAEHGYSIHQQAFFPLFPCLIKIISSITRDYVFASLLIVYISLFISLFLLFKLSVLNYSYSSSVFTLLFFLFFPTSFFLGNIYSESLCLAFILGSFYAARKKRWVLAGILGAFASATRLIGIFVLPALLIEWMVQHATISKKEMPRVFVKNAISFFLIPIGLLSYMFYLWKTHGDALLFIHSQPEFGANRSGGDLIFLPQVIYRYIKIFLTLPPEQFVFWIAILEFVVFFIAISVLFLYRKKIRMSYLLFAVLAIIFPSLTGTFSSEPRYALLAFPLFMVLGDIKNTRTKIILLFISTILLVVLTMYFTRGYFVA